MSKQRKTINERLDEMLALNTQILEEIKSLHEDLNRSNTELIAKEAPVNVEVKTSSAEEIKEALKPLTKEIITIKGRM